MTSCSTLSDRVSAARFSLWRGKTQRAAGFSLVEVVLAIGVVAFAFVALLGLLPTGLSTFRKAMDVSVGAQIFQKVMDDARQTDFRILVDDTDTKVIENPGTSTIFQAPSLNTPLLRYFDESGSEIIPPSFGQGSKNGSMLTPQQKLQVLYYVNTRISAPTVLPVNSAGAGAVNPYLATITVQIASNPGNLPLTFVSDQSDPNYLLFKPTQSGIAVTTFTGLVGYTN
jgi:type II secretory pathway pseudopilin PulG